MSARLFQPVVSHRRHRSFICGGLVLIAGIFATANVATGADLSQAVVRQKINVVTVAPNLRGPAQPATQGAVIHDENVVRTGVESRAELEFTDLTLARLGANSIFSFDAKARAMNFQQGAVLFSKPTKSGPVELRTGAITAAITGSTGFISNSSSTHSKHPSSTTLVGMLEGKMHGGSSWTDKSGHQHTTPFKLGPGELLVSRPDGPPRVAQFDLPRFIRTSPLVNGFKNPLRNLDELNRAVAEYRDDERRGFVDQTNVMVVSTRASAWDPSSKRMAVEVSVAELSKIRGGDSGFVDIGGTGVIRGQLVWRTDADLDLYLTLPDGQQISYKNVSVTFNNGRATGQLDHDNLGNTIDVQPNVRVENIVVNGVPSSGLYSFFVNSFGTQNGSDAFSLRVNYNGSTQLITGSLSNGQTSQPVTVVVPPGG
ncbi:MAG: hypothetical protein QOH88_2199 [Verrucomicrobiota bacterium]|jgi:hypothetical protein